MNPAAPERAPASRLSAKAAQFTESVIREMTRLAIAHGAVNLAQGFPDFPAPEEIKHAAQDAIAADINQYAITWGAKSIRDAIAGQFARTQGPMVDPEREITVCCGSTEAMMSAMMALINPGDEVVVFEPFYENYGPDAILSGATPRFVPLHPPREGSVWTFDPQELAAAFGPRTKVLILNTPNNPTGKVFTRAELECIRDLVVKSNAFVITDEIYEHMVYDGAEHISLAALDGMRERTITINALSKTYSVTGWRVGWAIAPPEVTSAIRKVHDFLTVGAAAPLQEAGAIALQFSDAYYRKLAADYLARRDKMLGILSGAGFRCFKPSGAYYIMTDISAFGFPDDVAFARHLVAEIGVAAVPGSSFYHRPADGGRQVRFAFCKKDATLEEAGRRLAKLGRAGG
ncbi:MAG TPA: aminotransferase class I/II-fold pyridoxal phosphate-dependent enzyme [Candidatus Acidoferrales bacterium]|nr:aminotransferase class I/II-fold pyridoxal phosphate-dependent enzyme [Candidatus Acidoferrales bacterium]